jgi:hypothetical protein
LLRRVVWQKFADVSEMLAASVIRAIALMMETVCFFETLASIDESTRNQNPEEQHNKKT